MQNLLFTALQVFNIARYDKSSTLFSPDGELLQISYAMLAGKRGKIAICAKSVENNIVICSVSQRWHQLLDKKSLEKVEKVDKKIFAVNAGLAGDGLALVKKSRTYAGIFRLKFGFPISVRSLSTMVGKDLHSATISGG